MIRLAPDVGFPDFVVEHLCRRLFMAFGIGCEATDPVPQRQGPVSVAEFLAEVPPAHAYEDDRSVFVLHAPLILPDGPLGVPPGTGWADKAAGLAVITADGLESPGSDVTPESEAAFTDYADRIARRAVQQVGLLWGLHRCLDVRCAMYVPWSPATAASAAEPTLCDYCREKSEARLRRTRS